MANPSTWSRLDGEPADFGVRSLRRLSLDETRAELEGVLGLQFAPDHSDAKNPAFACTVPACEMRLNSWPSEIAEFNVLNFIGSPTAGEDGLPRAGEDISAALAARLRDAGRDWYVPHKNEFLEEAGLLGDRLLDRAVIVSILVPQWLSGLSGDEQDAAARLLESIASAWLSAAQRTADPIADVKRRKLELQRLFDEPSARLRILASYAVKEQVSS